MKSTIETANERSMTNMHTLLYGLYKLAKDEAETEDERTLFIHMFEAFRDFTITETMLNDMRFSGNYWRGMDHKSLKYYASAFKVKLEE